VVKAKRERDDSAQTKTWFVRNEQGARFGPVDFETLKAWACDGRIGPNNEVSATGDDWQCATEHRVLEMDCVAEITPGSFYGPIHRDAMRGLLQDGTISPQVVLFRRSDMADERLASEAALRDERLRQQKEEASRLLVADLKSQLQCALEREEKVRQDIERQRQDLLAQAAQRAETDRQEMGRLRSEQAAQAEQWAGRVRQAEQRSETDRQEVARLRAELTAQAEQWAQAGNQESQSRQAEAVLLADRMRQAEQRAETERMTSEHLRQELAAQAEAFEKTRCLADSQSARAAQAEQRLAQAEVRCADAERRVAQAEARCVEAERRVEKAGEALLSLRHETAAQMKQARQALRQEQTRSAELDRLLSQAGQARSEAERSLDAARSDYQTLSLARDEERRVSEGERQALLTEVSRALAESASRMERVSQLERTLAETERAAERERVELDCQVSALRTEAASAQKALIAQREVAKQAQSQVDAVTASLETARRERDEERQGRTALSATLSELNQEVAVLRDDLRRQKERDDKRASSARVDVLEAEPLESQPRSKARAKPQPEMIEAEVLPPVRPAAEPRSAPRSKSSGGTVPPGLSMADLEQQARRELERLGTRGAAFFVRKR